MGVCEFPAAELKYLQVDLGKHFCDVAHNTFLLSTLELCLEPQKICCTAYKCILESDYKYCIFVFVFVFVLF